MFFGGMESRQSRLDSTLSTVDIQLKTSEGMHWYKESSNVKNDCPSRKYLDACLQHCILNAMHMRSNHLIPIIFGSRNRWH